MKSYLLHTRTTLFDHCLSDYKTPISEVSRSKGTVITALIETLPHVFFAPLIGHLFGRQMRRVENLANTRHSGGHELAESYGSQSSWS